MTDRSDTPARRPDWRHVVVLLAATLLSMGMVLRNDFVDWDDPHTLRDNPNFNPPTFDGLLNQWTAPLGGLYVPLTYTCWWIAAHFAGNQALSATPFHLLSLLTHALAAIALLYLLRQLIPDDLAALAGAVLFALHPVQVEAVAWASGYKDVLCGLSSIVALGQYIEYVRTQRTSRYFLAVIALLAAMLAKPQAVVVPGMMLAIDWLILRRRMNQVFRTIAPLLPISAAWMVLTARVQNAQDVTTQVSLLLRPLVALDSIAFYLFKLAWPIQLAPDYSRTPQYVVQGGLIAYSWIVPVLVATAIAVGRSRIVIAAAMLFAVALAPVSGLATFLFQEFSTVADHYLYLPMTGLALAGACLASVVPRRVAVVGLGLLIPILGVLSSVQMTRWTNTQTLFRHNLAVNPRSSVATNNIAFALLDSDLPEAERLARRAIELKPNNVDAMVNLATALAKQGRPADAARVLEQAIQIRPRMADAHSSLAAAYGELGRFDDARRQCQIALSLDPRHKQAQFIWSLLQRAPTTASTQP